MDKVAKNLDNINQTLKKQNQLLERLLDVQLRPRNLFIRILEYSGLIVGTLGILGVIDTIRAWIIGG